MGRVDGPARRAASRSLRLATRGEASETVERQGNVTKRKKPLPAIIITIENRGGLSAAIATYLSRFIAGEIDRLCLTDRVLMLERDLPSKG